MIVGTWYTQNGTVTLNSTRIRYLIEYRVASQNTSTKTSVVEVRSKIQRLVSSWNFDTVGTRNQSITIDGNTQSWTMRVNCNPWPSNPYTLGTKSRTVTHNSDGTKSITISARSNGTAASYGYSNSTASSADATASVTVELPTIAKIAATHATPTSITIPSEQFPENSMYISWAAVGTAAGTLGYDIQVYKNGVVMVDTAWTPTDYTILALSYAVGDELYARARVRASETSTHIYAASGWRTSTITTVSASKIAAQHATPASITIPPTINENENAPISWDEVVTEGDGYQLKMFKFIDSAWVEAQSLQINGLKYTLSWENYVEGDILKFEVYVRSSESETHIYSQSEAVVSDSITVGPAIEPPPTPILIHNLLISPTKEFGRRVINNEVIYSYENNDRLFVNFSKNRQLVSKYSNLKPNVDYHSKPNTVAYFPSSNFTVLGADTEITGYHIVGDTLITFKNDLNSAWVRQGMLLNETEVFPTTQVETFEQVLKTYQRLTTHVTVTDNGVNEIKLVDGGIDYYKRSLYVNDTYKQIVNPSFVLVKDKLYVKDIDSDLMIVADLNIRTNIKYEVDYQWEWLIYKDLPLGRLYQDGNDIYIIDEFGSYLCQFDTDKRNDALLTIVEHDPVEATGVVVPLMLEDEVSLDGLAQIEYVYKTYNNFESYWETPLLNFGTITIAKTIKNLYLNTRNKLGDRFEFGYILPDGTTEIIKKFNDVLQDDFPQLLSEKEKIKKFMWIKFYIKSLKTEVEFTATNYWKFRADGNDYYDIDNAVSTDITYSDGAIFAEGLNGKIEISKISMTPFDTYHPIIQDEDLVITGVPSDTYNKTFYNKTFGFEVLPDDLTTPQILVNSLDRISTGGNWYWNGWCVYFNEDAEVCINVYINAAEDTGNPYITINSGLVLENKLNKVMVSIKDTGIINVYVNGLEYSITRPNVPLHSYPIGKTVLGFIDGVPPVTILNNFVGTIRNFFIINEHFDDSLTSFNCLENLTFTKEVEEPAGNSTFDILQIEWQDGGKYRGD